MIHNFPFSTTHFHERYKSLFLKCKKFDNLITTSLFLLGEVELENVPLRKDALRHLDMPVEVRAGFVGKVKLQIPVSRLRSEPWVIIFEQLYLVAGPVKLDEVCIKICVRFVLK